MYEYGINFEYDPAKSEKNREKHGISLEAARALWRTAGVEVAARTTDEPRFLRIGKVEGKLYSAVFTLREGRIRLISVRRSRELEAAIYMRWQDEKEKS